MATLVCHSCGTPITYGEPVPRDAECEKCRADLRTCRNCRHWNPRLNNECNETEADSIADKTRRNFCEFFYYSREPFTGSPGGVDQQKSREAEARRKLEELFRKPAKPSAPSSPEPDDD